LTFCSFCSKRIWIWQNRWSLANLHEKPHDYWHTKCATPLHEKISNAGMNLDQSNQYLKSITRMIKHSLGDPQ